MTPKSLFNIILKTLGIFFIKDILEAVPTLVSSIFAFTNADAETGLYTLFFTLLMVGVYMLVSFYLIFRTNQLIEFFKLDSGFNEDSLSFTVSSNVILRVAIIVTAAFILTNEIPELCRALYFYLLEKRLTYGQTTPDISYAILSTVKIIIALLLIGERTRIVSFIENIKTKKASNEPEV